MKIGELARKIQVSRTHAWRLASSGIVPGTKRTKHGHFYFVESAALARWINYMSSPKFRKKQMKRAYAGNYGSEEILCLKQFRYQMKQFRKAERLARKNITRAKLISNDVVDYWLIFHRSIVSLEVLLRDWNDFSQSFNLTWPKMMKRQMVSPLRRLNKGINRFMLIASQK